MNRACLVGSVMVLLLLSSSRSSAAPPPAYEKGLLEELRKARAKPAPAPKPGERLIAGQPDYSGRVGPSVALDTRKQVLSLDLVTQGEAPLERSVYYLGGMGRFTSAGMLALKAKQFDDGLYAAVELAVTRGRGRAPGRLKLLGDLLAALTRERLAGPDLEAGAVVLASAQLGGLKPAAGPELQKAGDKAQAELLADALRSKPLGFYTWSEELGKVFQRDRMLQTPLGEKALVVARVLSREPKLLAAYSTSLVLVERLTNPLVAPDLRAAAADLRAGKTPSLAKDTAIMPASMAHETELVKKLFGNKPIPPGFNLAEELIKRIRAGSLSLKPRPTSGWYDRQTWALEPLVVPERMPEARHLKLSSSYHEHLQELFKSLLAATRETHIKQLEVPGVGAGPPQVMIAPGLTVEPLASYYQRRAEAYRFVRSVLEEAFGKGELGKMRRVAPAGPSSLALDEELRLMEQLFRGAYLTACDQLGLEPDKAAGEPSDRDVLKAWAAYPIRDPDLFQDVRMMVPVFYDLARRKTKVWAILGLQKRILKAGFATRPAVRAVKDASGKPLPPAVVQWGEDEQSVVQIVAAEVYVSQLLDRDQFQKHCDRHKTARAILANLR